MPRRQIRHPSRNRRGRWPLSLSAVVVELDAAKPTEVPVAANTSAAAEIHRPLRLDSNRRALGPRPGMTSAGLVDSLSFMMALLLLRQLCSYVDHKGSREELC